MLPLEPALASALVAAGAAGSAWLAVSDHGRPSAQRAAVGRKNPVEGAGVAATVLGIIVAAGALAAHPFQAPPPAAVSEVAGPLTWLDVEPMGGDNTYSTKGGSLYDCLVMAGPMTSAARFRGCPFTSVPDGYKGRAARLTLAGDAVVAMSLDGLTDGTLSNPMPDPAAPARRARRWLDAAAALVIAGLALRAAQRRD